MKSFYMVQTMIFTLMAVFAPSAWSSIYPVEGQLVGSDGNPVTWSALDIRLEIIDPSDTCILFSEDHIATQVLAGGLFYVNLGHGHLTSPVINSDLDLVMSPIAGGVLTGVSVADGSTCNYTVLPTETRRLRVGYSSDNGSTFFTMDQTLLIGDSAYATHAQTLGGRGPAEFVSNTAVAGETGDLENQLTGLFTNLDSGTTGDALIKTASGFQFQNVSSGGVNSVSTASPLLMTGTAADPSLSLQINATHFQVNGSNELELKPIPTASIPNLPTSKITSGTFVDARIPNLAASKITTGTFADGRIPSLAASKITTGTFVDGRIPSLAASKINSGTFATARIPGLPATQITSGTLNVARIPNLAATKITSGTLNAARIPGLDASKITGGTFAAARIPSLSAANVNSGTLPLAQVPSLPASQITTGSLNTARIPNLNASKINAGILNIGRIPTGTVQNTVPKLGVSGALALAGDISTTGEVTVDGTLNLSNGKMNISDPAAPTSLGTSINFASTSVARRTDDSGAGVSTVTLTNVENGGVYRLFLKCPDAALEPCLVNFQAGSRDVKTYQAGGGNLHLSENDFDAITFYVFNDVLLITGHQLEAQP